MGSRFLGAGREGAAGSASERWAAVRGLLRARRYGLLRSRRPGGVRGPPPAHTKDGGHGVPSLARLRASLLCAGSGAVATGSAGSGRHAERGGVRDGGGRRQPRALQEQVRSGRDGRGRARVAALPWELAGRRGCGLTAGPRLSLSLPATPCRGKSNLSTKEGESRY